MNENTQHPAPKTIRVATPADVIASVTHALGFEPRESFAFRTLRGNTLGATMRFDVPDDATRPVDYAQAITHYLLSDTAADGVLMFVYSNEATENICSGEKPNARPYREYAKAIEAEAERGGMTMQSSWLITDKEWIAYFCDDEGCCTPHPMHEVRDSVLNAEKIYHGSNTSRSLARFLSDSAFIGSDVAHEKIQESVFWIERHGAPKSLDMDHSQMRKARAQWNEAVGEDLDDEAMACELVSYLFVNSIRDRLLADAISPSNDVSTYQQILAGEYEGQLDWSRVEAIEVLLVQLISYTPPADRAPLFCFLGWLSTYKGEGTFAVQYLDIALEIDDEHLMAGLLKELLAWGFLPKVARSERNGYRRN